MSWMETLSKTYDYCEKAVADESCKTALLPLAHLTAEAQITITIDCNGNFKGAEKVDKGNGTTIIPVTEDSGARTSGPEPHPLCDKLIFIAGDYFDFVKPDEKRSPENYYDKYIELLEEWEKSDFSTEKVEAIYLYTSKRSVIKDLVNAGILKCNFDNMLDEKERVSGTKQIDCFVRFKVLNPDKIKYISETWRDAELYDSFIKFNASRMKNEGICYITGKNNILAEKHPAKIRNTGDKAKIISSNDEKNFVFNGRFLNANEAVTIGYEVSQKAHNALRWLIGNQGYRNESSYIVCWSIKGEKLPDILNNSDSMFDDIEEDDEDAVINTGQIFAEKLNKAIAGYYQRLDNDDKIIIMSVDSADGTYNGRLSIKYYNEFTKDRYLENIKSWYEKCSWKLFCKNGKIKYEKVGSPIPKEIAEAAYGNEKNKNIAVNDNVKKECIERILPCIIEGRQFPKDILLSAVRNVSRAEAFSKDNHNKLIAITCAVIKAYGNCKNNKGDAITMELNNNNDRSYLFGRLLAVADILEERTYESDEKGRVTNARRYWNNFSKKPAKTWEIILRNLQPYITKQEKYKSYYNMLFEDIHNKLYDGNGFNDNALTPDYVLGYWCQRNAMNAKKASDNSND